MGGEFGQFIEWNEKRPLDWFLLEYPHHSTMLRYVKDLNNLYLNEPALWVKDFSWEGFEWINCINANDCNLSWLRKSGRIEETLLICVNFANVDRKNYEVGVPYEGKYTEILNSDEKKYGGQGRVNASVRQAKPSECDGREYAIRIRQAPLSISIFSYTPYTPEEKEAIRALEEEKARKREAAQAVKAEKKAEAERVKSQKKAETERLKARKKAAGRSVKGTGKGKA